MARAGEQARSAAAPAEKPERGVCLAGPYTKGDRDAKPADPRQPRLGRRVPPARHPRSAGWKEHRRQARSCAVRGTFGIKGRPRGSPRADSEYSALGGVDELGCRGARVSLCGCRFELLQLFESFLPRAAVLLGGDGSAEIGIEVEDCGSQFRCNSGEPPAGKLIE